MMHEYRGFPQRTDQGGYLVTKDGLPFRKTTARYGALELALALLLDVTKDIALATHLHQEFKEEMIATIPIDTPWVMLDLTISSWVRQKKILEKVNINYSLSHRSGDEI